MTTNIIVLIAGKEASKLVVKLEKVVKEFDAEDFRIRLAGAPYVVAMIQRNLVHDFAWFSITAVILFGGAMLPIFRSFRILTGMLATCISAILLSLTIQVLLGMKIGILTANLSTIGLLPGDAVTLSTTGMFSDPQVANNKTVVLTSTLTGATEKFWP